MEKILVRLANASDYNDVEAIMKQVQQLHVDWRPDLYKMGEIVFPYEMYLHAVEDGTFLVAEWDEKIVGFLFYQLVHIENDNQISRNVIFIDSMGVDASFRGKGVGHQLFDHVKKIKQERNVDKIELQVNAKNTRAREMYGKYGFKEKAVTLELEEL